ncbi:hypothetical protein A2U01_0025924, partial [Trifolium medium]|nr:hypothetical protein [Trifolium medium]
RFWLRKYLGTNLVHGLQSVCSCTDAVMEKLDGRGDAIKVTQGVLGMKLFKWHTGIG